MKRILINEGQLNAVYSTEHILTENRASKNQSLARKVVRALRPEADDKEVTSDILHDIPNVRMAEFHLYPAVTRMVLQNYDHLDRDIIQRINRYVGMIADKVKEQGYNQDLNGMSLQEFFDTFQTEVGNGETANRENSAKFGQGDGKYNGYDIVPISTFEEAQKYSKYTDWCVTENQRHFILYTNDGRGLFYFLLKKGFENVEKRVGENAPLDEYGLSMIAVSFDMNGSVNTISCRWNHDNGGNDNVMSPEQVSKVIGADIHTIFNKEDKKTFTAPEGIKMLKTYEKEGLFLCQDTDKNVMCVYNHNYSVRFDYNGKNYICAETMDGRGENELNVFLDNKGNIIYEVVNDFVNYDDVNDTLIIAVGNDEGGCAFDTTTFKKIVDSGIHDFSSCEKLYVLENSEEKYQIIDTVNKYALFDRWIDYANILYDINIDDYVLCIHNNYISLISGESGRYSLEWTNILKSMTNHFNDPSYLVKDKNGIYRLIIAEPDKVHNIPLNKAYETNYDNVKYLIVGNEEDEKVFAFNSELELEGTLPLYELDDIKEDGGTLTPINFANIIMNN